MLCLTQEDTQPTLPGSISCASLVNYRIMTGAPLSATCSMCEAGTYWSGSGQKCGRGNLQKQFAFQTSLELITGREHADISQRYRTFVKEACVCATGKNIALSFHT